MIEVTFVSELCVRQPEPNDTFRGNDLPVRWGSPNDAGVYLLPSCYVALAVTLGELICNQYYQ